MASMIKVRAFFAAATFQKRFLLLLAGYGGITLALAIGSYVAGSALASRAQELADLKLQLAFNAQAASSYLILKSEYDRARLYEPVLAAILPKENQVFDFRNTVKNSAAQRTVELTFSFGTQDTAGGGKTAATNFQMTANGTYANLLAFLRDVERSPYFVQFTTVNISVGASGATASFSGKLFSQ